MAGLGFSAAAVGNNKTAGVSSITVNSGAAFADYKDTFTSIYDAKFKQTPYSRKKSIGAERSYGFMAQASWKYMLVNYTNIAALPAFTVNSVVGINFVNGDNANLGDSTAGGCGVPKWKVVIEGDADKDRYIEFMAQRAGMWTGSATGFDNDSLWGAALNLAGSSVLSGTAMPPAGIRKLEVRATDTYEELGFIRNGKFAAELMCDTDFELRYVPRNVHIEYDIEVMDCTPTTLALLDSWHDLASIDVKFTLVEGMVFTGADILGGLMEVVVEGDSDRDAIIRVTGSGDVELSAFAALFAAS